MVVDHSDSPLSSCTLPPQTNKTFHFSSSISGAAGLLGGDDAVAVLAMAAVHVSWNRRWLGWYNSPGSFQIARWLHSFIKLTSFRNSSMSLSRDIHVDSMSLFKSDGCKGPKFRATQSRTVVEDTGYLTKLFMKECAACEGKVVPGRRTQTITITIADLPHPPISETRPASDSAFTILFAGVTIFVSISACALCAVFEDWVAFLMTLVGIVATGISCLVLGSADLAFTHPEPAEESLPGDGILSSDNDIVLLRGTEPAVNSVTQLSLRFSGEAHFSLVRSCSVLFFIQFIAQFLLLPHASLRGQVMFFASLSASALYNAWLSSSDKEEVYQKLLLERVPRKAKLAKYKMGSPTVAAVFILLVLQPQDPAALLDEHLPGDNKVWRQWKTATLEQLRHPCNPLPERNTANLKGFSRQERGQLQLLYDDARAAYIAYRDYLGVDPL